jgi:hypothetical protein
MIRVQFDERKKLANLQHSLQVLRGTQQGAVECFMVNSKSLQHERENILLLMHPYLQLFSTIINHNFSSDRFVRWRSKIMQFAS